MQYDRVVYLLEDNEITRDLLRKKVTIYDCPSGTIAIKYLGLALPCSVFDKLRQVKQADVVSNKRLGAVLKFVHEKQEYVGYKRSKRRPNDPCKSSV